jgi:hypothetical protein
VAFGALRPFLEGACVLGVRDTVAVAGRLVARLLREASPGDAAAPAVAGALEAPATMLDPEDKASDIAPGLGRSR